MSDQILELDTLCMLSCSRLSAHLKLRPCNLLRIKDQFQVQAEGWEAKIGWDFKLLGKRQINKQMKMPLGVDHGGAWKTPAIPGSPHNGTWIDGKRHIELV